MYKGKFLGLNAMFCYGFQNNGRLSDIMISLRGDTEGSIEKIMSIVKDELKKKYTQVDDINFYNDRTNVVVELSSSQDPPSFYIFYMDRSHKKQLEEENNDDEEENKGT